MVTIPVNLPRTPYAIIMQRGLLSHVGEEAAAVTRARRIALIADTNVAPLYAAVVKESLEAAGFAVQTLSLPAGEENKTDATLHMIYELLLTCGFTRGDAVAALGGGVVGDVAGYAAATLFRGMDFIQIPTSLMAQADSSVGGKTGVDLPQGKNLLGAFHQPKVVLMDTACLDSLPERELRCGMAEIIKYGFIADASILELLEQGDQPDFAALLPKCLAIKAHFVEEDEEDRGVRRLLNFGHTLGHAYEVAGGYLTHSHGEAVAAGMVAMLRIEERLGLVKPEVRERLTALLNQFGLPAHMDCSEAALSAAVGLDKKSVGGTMHPVYVTSVGNAVVGTIEKKDFLALWQKG